MMATKIVLFVTTDTTGYFRLRNGRFTEVTSGHFRLVFIICFLLHSTLKRSYATIVVETNPDQILSAIGNKDAWHPMLAKARLETNGSARKSLRLNLGTCGISQLYGFTRCRSATFRRLGGVFG